MRPSAVKGSFLRKVSISTTMGPGAMIAWEA
jgi:ribosomal protein L1